MSTALNPTQKYMLRLVLFNAGKTIQHKNRICEVVETHDQLRQLQPLVDEDLTEPKTNPFWVPRRPVARKELRNERIRRLYIGGIRSPFNPPHWTGDSMEGLTAVPLPASGLDSEYVLTLVRDLGYPIDAALAAMAHPPRVRQPDRRRKVEEGGNTVIAQPVSYTAAPSRRTERGGFTRDSVRKAIARMRASSQMRLAVFEVVFSRRSPSRISVQFGVGTRALNKAASRIRKDIRHAGEGVSEGVQKPNKNAASEALMGSSWHIYEGSNENERTEKPY